MTGNRHGQVMIETALSLTAVVVFLWVLLRVWMWMNGMIVGRQVHFQRSRVEAGSTNPGRPVPFNRPKLRLFGNSS